MDKYSVFLKVVETGSFTEAAQDLGYTQSAVSQIVLSLEKELFSSLLLRDRKGVALTSEGKDLLPYIRSISNSHRQLSEKAYDLHGLKGGTVRIGTYSSMSCHVLPPLMKNFGSKYPEIKFELLQGDYDATANWIKAGRVDFGLLPPKAFPDLEITILKKDRMMAVLPPRHHLSKRKTVPLSDLAKESYIHLEEGSFSEPFQAFDELGVFPRIRFRVHDDYTIMSMVESGLGVSVLSELVLNRTSYNIEIRETDPPVIRTIGIACKSRRALSAANNEFINYIMKEIK
jgi:DNA-binding transcriptional LysR family regulator